MSRTVLVVLLVAVVVAVVYFGVSPAKAAAATTVPKPPLVIPPGDELAPEVRARVEATKEIRREVSAGNLPPSALPPAAGPTGVVKNVVAEGFGVFSRAVRNAQGSA